MTIFGYESFYTSWLAPLFSVFFSAIHRLFQNVALAPTLQLRRLIVVLLRHTVYSRHVKHIGRDLSITTERTPITRVFTPSERIYNHDCAFNTSLYTSPYITRTLYAGQLTC